MNINKNDLCIIHQTIWKSRGCYYDSASEVGEFCDFSQFSGWEEP